MFASASCAAQFRQIFKPDRIDANWRKAPLPLLATMRRYRRFGESEAPAEPRSERSARQPTMGAAGTGLRYLHISTSRESGAHVSWTDSVTDPAGTLARKLSPILEGSPNDFTPNARSDPGATPFGVELTGIKIARIARDFATRSRP